LLSSEKDIDALDLSAYLESDWALVEEGFGVWVAEQRFPL
jgi:hypothetical protein